MDPRLEVARAAFKTVSIAVRDDVLDDALLAVLRAIDVLAETPATVREVCEPPKGPVLLGQEDLEKTRHLL